MRAHRGMARPANGRCGSKRNELDVDSRIGYVVGICVFLKFYQIKLLKKKPTPSRHLQNNGKQLTLIGNKCALLGELM